MKDSTYNLTYISEDGNVIIKDENVAMVDALSYYDTKDSVIKYFYNVKKEIGLDKKKLANGATRYVCALYDYSGKKIIDYSLKINEFREIYLTKNNEVKVLVGQEVAGGDDCAPIFKYGVYNLNKKDFDFPIKFDKIQSVYFDSYGSQTKLKRDALQKAALELINSDRKFESLYSLKLIFDSLEYVSSSSDNYEYRQFQIMSSGTNHDVYENDKLIKTVSLPEKYFIAGAYDLSTGYYDEYGYVGSYSDLIWGDDSEKKPVNVLRIQKEGDYYSNNKYIKLDEEDKTIYVQKNALGYDVQEIFDSLKYTIIFENEHFNLLDSSRKNVFEEGVDRIWITYGDDRNVFYIELNDLEGVYHYDGSPIIKTAYTSLYNTIDYKFIPAYIGELKGSYTLLTATGTKLIPDTKNKLEFITINDDFFVKESTEIFSKVTNGMEWRIEGFYDLKGKKFNGKN